MRFFKKRKSILPPAAEHIEANLANSVIYVKDLQKMYFTARALANSPEVLLMDEPFSALDPQTKADMQLLMRQIWQVEKPTVMFVTHDIEEAVFLSSKIYVLTARPGIFLFAKALRQAFLSINQLKLFKKAVKF